MQELVFLVNPHAGKGRSRAFLTEARSKINRFHVRGIEPRTEHELSKICSELDPATTRAAVVLGGDGTQHFAIRGLTQSGVPLYPFPGGTANDLSKELGIRDDWAQFESLIEGPFTREMDLISVNGIPFATVAGLGIGANLTEEYNHLRNRSPWFKAVSKNLSSEIYSLLSVKNIIQNWGKPMHLKIHADYYHERIKTAAMFICNQSSLGGNLKVAPKISNSDKRFSVLIIPYSSGWSTLRDFSRMRMGILCESFISFSTDHLEVSNLTGEPLQVFGDGEPLMKSDLFEFNLHPKKLRIFSDSVEVKIQ